MIVKECRFQSGVYKVKTFGTLQKISIRDIFINDGESVYKLEANTIRITEDWKTIPLGSMGKDISWGIGIMMVVIFATAGDKASEILFSAAGCTIKSNF